MIDVDSLAAHLVATKRGIGMVPPFYAETASVKGDPNWHYWIVRNETCNSLGKLIPGRELAERLAEAMNKITQGTNR